MSYRERIVSALDAVLPSGADELRPRLVNEPNRDVIVTIAGADLLVRWLTTGWPRQVAEALHCRPRPDILAAPTMSSGARKAAADGQVGWVDESGQAQITIPGKLIVNVERRDVPPKVRLGWRRATLAVCEAILSDRASPTVSSVESATGLSTGSVVAALRFLEDERHLTKTTARGPRAARRVVDRDLFVDAYAEAAEHLRSPISIPIGVLWRDPIAGLVATGRPWDAAGIAWAATGALSASVLAPTQTEVSPLEVYVHSRTWSDLRRAAQVAGLQEIVGGRLALRPFPTPAGATLSEQAIDGFRSTLWPRVYADLRTSGVRGEDAAEHLRQEMTK